MKQTILKYGGYGSVLICILFLLAWYAGSGLDMSTQELIGYASMVVALSFVYFGIRHFRDRLNSGTLSMGQGIGIGLGISLITALAFGLLDVIYVVWLNPEFMDNYYETVLSDLQATLPEAEYLVRKAELEAQKDLFTSPVMNFVIMASTVFLIGLIITLLSTLVLKRRASDVTA